MRGFKIKKNNKKNTEVKEETSVAWRTDTLQRKKRLKRISKESLKTHNRDHTTRGIKLDVRVRRLTATGGSGSSTIDGLEAAALLWVFLRLFPAFACRVAPLLTFSSFSSAELRQDEPFGVVLADEEEFMIVELEHQSFHARLVVGPITGSSRSLFWSEELLEEVSELSEALVRSLRTLRTLGASSSCTQWTRFSDINLW